jgi:ABC-type transporter Mla subunit MlaD
MSIRTARTRRRRRDTPPVGQIVRRGLLVWTLVAAVILFGVLVVNGVPGRNYLNVKVDVPQTGNLLTHDPVRIGGARVGQISKREVGPDGQPRLSLQLEPGLKISRDTKVQIRANGLLGARYVELVPGREATMLGEGDVIRASQNALTYGVPDALNTFDQQTRGALGKLVNGAGSGLLTNGAPLNAAIAQGARQIGPFQGIVSDIFARPGALERLVPSLDATTSALSDSRRDLSLLPGSLGRALAPLATEREALQNTIALAPGTLIAVRSGTAQGTHLVAALDGLVKNVNRALPGAPSALRETTRLLRGARQPLVDARQVVARVPGAVPAVLGITKRLRPLLPHAQKTLEPLIPMLDEVARHGCDVTNFAAGFRSMTGIGGSASGPNGPGGEFRLLVVLPAGSEALGIQGVSVAPLPREGYSPPCKYTNKTYATFPALTQLPRAGAKGGKRP